MPQKCLAARPRVMVIHHQTDFALKLADWIAALGYEAAIARNVEDMLALLHEARPDGILLDLQLQAVGGMQVLRLLKAIHPEVPVVTITEGPLGDLALLSVRAGASAFLIKPFELEHLNTALVEHVRTRSGANPSDIHRPKPSVHTIWNMAPLAGETGR